MLRSLLAGLFAVAVLSQSVHGEEDPHEAERQFRFLLSRGQELRAQSDTPLAATERWKAQIRRLKNDYRHFLRDYPQHARAMVAYGDMLYDQDNEEDGIRWWK